MAMEGCEPEPVSTVLQLAKTKGRARRKRWFICVIGEVGFYRESARSTQMDGQHAFRPPRQMTGMFSRSNRCEWRIFVIHQVPATQAADYATNPVIARRKLSGQRRLGDPRSLRGVRRDEKAGIVVDVQWHGHYTGHRWRGGSPLKTELAQRAKRSLREYRHGPVGAARSSTGSPDFQKAGWGHQRGVSRVAAGQWGLVCWGRGKRSS
jgi:hypothetical protein